MNPKRAVVVGMGSIGRRHARLLRGRVGVSVEVCETDPARLGQALSELGNVVAHTSYDALLASRPEIVFIATPHGLHADQTIAALEAGCDVFCEKPISDSLCDAVRMRDAAARTGRVLNTGFQLHFHPGARCLKALIDTGTLGTILHIHCRVGSYITLVNSASRYQASAEGALLLDYTHQPDLLYWLLGRRPAGVTMQALRGGALEFGSNPNVLALTCDYDVPLLATVHLNYVQMPERHEYEIVGDRGWAIWDLNSGMLRHGDRSSQTVSEARIATDRDPVYEAEHAAFLDAVAGRQPAESPPADAIVSLETVTAALRSWREGRRVTLDEQP